MIKIILVGQTKDLEGNPESRHCDVIIDSMGTCYQLSVGGLPLEGDLQTILNERHDKLLSVAVVKSDIKTTDEVIKLRCKAAWTSYEFQMAVMEHLIENVGKGTGMFRDLVDIYEAIVEESTM